MHRTAGPPRHREGGRVTAMDLGLPNIANTAKVLVVDDDERNLLAL